MLLCQFDVRQVYRFLWLEIREIVSIILVVFKELFLLISFFILYVFLLVFAIDAANLTHVKFASFLSQHVVNVKHSLLDAYIMPPSWPTP